MLVGNRGYIVEKYKKKSREVKSKPRELKKRADKGSGEWIFRNL